MILEQQQQQRGIIRHGHDTRILESIPDSNQVGNICAASKVKPVNIDLNINSHKDELENKSGGINPSGGADKLNVLDETLIIEN